MKDCPSGQRHLILKTIALIQVTSTMKRRFVINYTVDNGNR
ncbi:MAG: hypothetical protein SWO11_21935 [Thermodesulfobacteriota bacterium]|nr:hypothetical protein [Thermodesulfobacteriota bacterium]